MSLRSKLTIGLGFLFLIIFALAMYSSVQIQRLSKDADNILKDNYDSLVYCKNMLVAMDDMNLAIANRIFSAVQGGPSPYYSSLYQASQSAFESNLGAEKANITEIHETNYVSELTDNYAPYLNLCLQITERGGSSSLYLKDFLPSESKLRQSILRINDLNMQAVERKSVSTKHEAGKMIISIAAVGTLCIVLAFFYFWYFPFYVLGGISHLATKMRELLKSAGLNIEIATKDEIWILSHSIHLLEGKLAKQKGGRKGMKPNKSLE
jgi:ABC-type transport system involved in multi-copper enzyme maturation permease subunit